MDKIYKLEEQWKIYKSRKFISSLVLFFSFYALVGGFYYLYLKRSYISNFFLEKSSLLKVASQKELNISKPIALIDKNVIVKEDVIIQKEEEPKEVEVEELFFKPIIPIIDMDREVKKSSKRRRTAVVHRAKKESNRVKAKPSKYITPEELSKVKTASTHYMERDTTNLKRINLSSSSKNYIETMKKKFYRSKNPRDALLLAKAFYRDRKYRDSEKWGLEANRLDSNLDESWIIFAKSKAKLGRKKEAIKILAMYYDKSKSHRVRVAIDKIKVGKI